MSLISFDAALQRGGPIQFKGLPDAILWAQHQSRVWVEKFRLTLANNRDSNLSTVRDYWNFIVDDLQAHRARGGSVAVTLSDDVRMIIEGSPVFQAMSWAYDNLTKDGLEAAGFAAGLGGRLDWSIPEQVSAVLSYERILNKILSFEENEKSKKNQIISDDLNAIIEFNKKQMEDLSNRFSDLKDKGDKLDTLFIRQASVYNELVGSAEKNIQDKIMENNYSIDKEREGILNSISEISDKSKEAIENWVSSFQEQRRLEAPVALWRTRAELHENTLRKRKWWLIGIGSIGLTLAFIISISSFEFAKMMFSDVTIPGSGQSGRNSGALRPSFHFEIITASAATLIYLTMYLWVMRLLMRLYTAEHHLATDAYGRSALTETYLSLTQDGAATDADRAIMLSVIFRPVIDGMVKEDGPPAISPAAVIAGLASGPTKTN